MLCMFLYGYSSDPIINACEWANRLKNTSSWNADMYDTLLGMQEVCLYVRFFKVP